MSFLLIESGSTKADWAFVYDEKEEVKYFQTAGLNPATNPKLNIEPDANIIAELQNISDVIFYGAGTGTIIADDLIRQFFLKFNSSLKISISSDLTAAINATAFDDAGIICILGTGSHSCLYNGYKVVDSIPSLGYLMSDEGSGNHIGKEILKSYFYNELSIEDKKLFEETYHLSRSVLLEKIYKSHAVSAYLAGFSTFLNHSSTAMRNKILEKCFDEFINVRIKKYEEYSNFDLYFVGSIAYHFQSELKKALAKHKLTAKEIIEKPMSKLIKYHKKNIYVKRD